MAKELYVSSTPHETKVAVVEEDQLSEIYFERENEYTLAGSIYKGRVTRVLPGMQSAFVNIGLERDAFLYVSDFLMEEDEDSDAIGEAVASSRNSPIIEVRSSQGQDGPIEAQEIMPPITVGDEEDDTEQESAEGASAEKGAPQEQEREGARKWRGRRRRGRGGRDRFNDRGAQDQAAGDRGEQDKPVEAATEEHNESQPESRPEPRHERHESRPEPRSEGRHEGRSDYRRENRRDRYESRPEQSFEQHAEPIVLPGESISKYQPHAAQSSTATQAAVKTESAPRPRPSTEYSIDPSAFAAGSMVLPGETLAKYGKDKPQSRGKSEAHTEHQAAERAAEHSQNTRSADFFRMLNPPVRFPRSLSRKKELKRAWKRPEFFIAESPRLLLRKRKPSSETTSRFEEPQTPATEAEEERFERMNVASVFGGGAAEVEETTEMDEEEQAEEATHLDSSLEAPEQEQQVWTPPAGDSENLLSRTVECKRAA